MARNERAVRSSDLSRTSTQAATLTVNGRTNSAAHRYAMMHPELDRKLKEYRRVLAETGERRERAVKTLRKAGYLSD